MSNVHVPRRLCLQIRSNGQPSNYHIPFASDSVENLFVSSLISSDQSVVNAHSLVLAAVSPQLANLLSADAADHEGNGIVFNNGNDFSDDGIVLNDGSDISDYDGNTAVSPHLATLLSADAAGQEGDISSDGGDISTNDGIFWYVGSDISDDDGKGITAVSHFASLLSADAADQEGDGNADGNDGSAGYGGNVCLWYK